MPCRALLTLFAVTAVLCSTTANASVPLVVADPVPLAAAADVEPLDDGPTSVAFRPGFQQQQQETDHAAAAKAAGRSTLACMLTFGTLTGFSVAITGAAMSCVAAFILSLVGVYFLVETWLIGAVVSFGSACGACGLAGILAFVAAGFTGMVGYLRAVGLWSWEAQMVFELLTRAFSMFAIVF